MPPARNRPEPAGHELGSRLARFFDDAAPRFMLRFGALPGRCKSCAFRAGTFPNGCVTTVMDALKCAVEHEPFYCHERPDPDGSPSKLCAGWAVLVTTSDGPPGRTFWKFSDEYSDQVEPNASSPGRDSAIAVADHASPDRLASVGNTGESQNV